MGSSRSMRACALVLSLGPLALSACRPETPRVVVVGRDGKPSRRGSDSSVGDFSAGIASKEVWAALAATPGTQHVARSEVVKTIFDRLDGKIYFLESRTWPIHYDFAARFLARPGAPIGDHAIFNQKEYKSDDRRFVLGTVTHYLDADRWTFDLFAGDSLPLEAVVPVFEVIKKSVYFSKELAYRPVPPSHEQALERARKLMPIATTDEIFAGIRFQPLELGEAYGTLRIVKKGEKLDPTSLRPWDVVVLAEQPDDIPVVSAIITDEIQAPLGHINVLCHNRKTPNMALRNASTDAELVALSGKIVKLTVGAQGYRITPATQADAERSWDSRRPKKGFTPVRDDRFIGLPLLEELRKEDVRFVGAKTAQLAIVKNLLPKEMTPRGFAVPFAAYARFTKDGGFDTRIQRMLADPAFRGDPARRARELDALRADMMKAPIADEVVSGILHRAESALPKGKIRFRSSTNAEDLPGFNGAGLYRSTRVNPEDRSDVLRGLREVWSSTWLSAAYEEREFYRIDHRTVGMGILVQESIDDDLGNGVAITANPFSQGNPGFFLNTQVSGGSVTGAKGGEIPEQILYYTYDGGRGFERLSRSSRAGGNVILEDAVVEELVKNLQKIHNAFTGDPFGASGRAVDVEYLVRKSYPRVIVVQARPYTMTWADERKWRDADGRLVQP